MNFFSFKIVEVIEEDLQNEEYQIFTKDGNPRKRNPTIY